MREILFRAKRANWRELPKEEWWIEGNLVWSNDSFEEYQAIIIPQENSDMFTKSEHDDLGFENWYLVDPETVCQYTNKSDDNGIPIYEEDFVKINDDWIGRVIWSERDTAFCVFPNDDIEHETYCLGYYISVGYQIEAIGNIFDNPEFLKDGQQPKSPITCKGEAE